MPLRKPVSHCHNITYHIIAHYAHQPLAFLCILTTTTHFTPALCCAVLCCAVACCAVLCHALLCLIMSYRVVAKKTAFGKSAIWTASRGGGRGGGDNHFSESLQFNQMWAEGVRGVAVLKSCVQRGGKGCMTDEGTQYGQGAMCAMDSSSACHTTTRIVYCPLSRPTVLAPSIPLVCCRLAPTCPSSCPLTVVYWTFGTLRALPVQARIPVNGQPATVC